MIARIVLKTPDALRDAIEKMAEDEVMGASDNGDKDIEFENLVEKCMIKAEKWFRYNELVTLEINFDKDTCTVVKN